MTTDLIEINFDGIVGPTHHFGGLGPGNLASEKHAGAISRPRAAALQGLDKIALVAQVADARVMRCAVLPPQIRPRLDWLRQLGFSGTTEQVLCTAAATSPELLRAAWSASSMWTANAATVSTANDCGDGKTHFTVANLFSSHHRTLEANDTTKTLRALFENCDACQIHSPMVGGWPLRDEGAANHMRLSDSLGRSGIDVFVAGPESSTGRFVSRQSVLACEAIARVHKLAPDAVCYLRQDQQAIDAGAFHNDVVATSHRNLLIYHERAFQDACQQLDNLQKLFHRRTGEQLQCIRITEDQLSLTDAIDSYFFNSQLIPLPNGTLMLLCPMQCSENQAARALLDTFVGEQTNISSVRTVDLRESMNNGGGPACLRLRVPLPQAVCDSLPTAVFWTRHLEDQLRTVIEQHYPAELRWQDLQSADFAEEAAQIVRRINRVLGFAA